MVAFSHPNMLSNHDRFSQIWWTNKNLHYQSYVKSDFKQTGSEGLVTKNSIRCDEDGDRHRGIGSPNV